MGKAVTFFSGTIFGLLLSGLVVTGIANTEIDKAYLIVSGQMISDEGLEAYSEKAGPVAQKAGINIIARNEQVTSDLLLEGCLLYTSPSPRDGLLSRMPSSA